MSEADLLSDLGRLGIRLEADGERLRHWPRSALTPDLLARLRTYKAGLLAMLRTAPDAPPTMPVVSSEAPAMPGTAVCRCGSTTWQDVPIHDGESVRRDCDGCGRFLGFPVWYAEGTGHNDQHQA
ncbi:MAG TPA: hypothetical protein VG826_12760 [Pirellulales bacterium]|nr:hypothetical protein [Pirellulales bacterium]